LILKSYKIATNYYLQTNCLSNLVSDNS